MANNYFFLVLLLNYFAIFLRLLLTLQPHMACFYFLCTNIYHWNDVTGMEIYPATSRLLEFVPEPLLAGVLGGAGFMCLALVLLLGSACVISHKRDQRRRKRKDGKNAPHSRDSADTHFDELHHEYHHLFNKILKALSIHYINHTPLHGFGAPLVPRSSILL